MLTNLKRRLNKKQKEEKKLKSISNLSAIIQTIITCLLLVVAFFQFLNSRNQAYIMDSQTKIMRAQEKIMKLQLQSAEDYQESQLKLLAEQNSQLSLQTMLSTEPQIDIILDRDLYKNEYFLSIENSGSIDITNIDIQKEIRYYNIIEHTASGVHSAYEWKKTMIIKPGQFEEYGVPYDDLLNAWKSVSALEKWQSLKVRESLFPAILFKISFRRLGDKREYRIRKFLFLMEGTINKVKTVIGFDPDVDVTATSSGDFAVYKIAQDIENKSPWRRQLSFKIERGKK